MLTEKDVYLVNTEYFWEEISVFFPLLSPEEQEKANAFLFSYLSKRYIIAHGILRILIARYLKLKANEVSLGYTIHGKPYSKNSPILHFNMSHSEDYVAYIFSYNHEVGIDIEYKKKELDFLPLLSTFLSPCEQKIFKEIPVNEQQDFFYKIWTLKESYLKAIGLGLSYPLSQLNIVPLLDKKIIDPILNSAEINNNFKEWSFGSLDNLPAYIGSVAIHHQTASFSILNFDFTFKDPCF